MKTGNTFQWGLIVLLALVALVQMRVLTNLQAECRTLRRQQRDVAVAEVEARRLNTVIEELRKQLETSMMDLERWREQYRQKEQINSGLREDLKRNETMRRELAAELELQRRKLAD